MKKESIVSIKYVEPGGEFCSAGECMQTCVGGHTWMQIQGRPLQSGNKRKFESFTEWKEYLLYDSMSQTLFACFMNHDHLNLRQENKEKYKDVFSFTFTTNPLLLFPPLLLFCLQTSDNQRSLACKAKLCSLQMFLVEDLENTLKHIFNLDCVEVVVIIA